MRTTPYGIQSIILALGLFNLSCAETAKNQASEVMAEGGANSYSSDVPVWIADVALPPGVAIVSFPAGINCVGSPTGNTGSCAAYFKIGTTLTLKIAQKIQTPDGKTFVFKGPWQCEAQFKGGASKTVTLARGHEGNLATGSFTPVQTVGGQLVLGYRNCGAYFEPVASNTATTSNTSNSVNRNANQGYRTLSIHQTALPRGYVFWSVPAGIDCNWNDRRACTAQFPYGARVTLHIARVIQVNGKKYQFQGPWQCQGSSSGVVKSPSTTADATSVGVSIFMSENFYNCGTYFAEVR